MPDKRICKSDYKRNITLLCMIGIFFFLISCGKEDKTVLQSEENDVSKKNVVKSGIQTDTLENVDTEGNYYAGEFAAIPERDAMELTAVSDTAIYYLKYDQLNDMRETLMRYDSESGQITELTDAIPEGSSIQKLCVNSEGHPMVITIGRKKEGEDQSICYRLIEMDENGNQIMEKELTGLLEETEGEGYLQYLKAGPDGRIYLGGGTMVWVLDKEGNEEFHLQTEAWIQEMGILPEGKLGVFVIGVGSTFVKVLNCEEKQWENTYTNDRFGISLSFTEPGKDGIYFYNSEELYSYDPVTGETEVVADWLYHDIYAESIMYLSVREDGLHMITCDHDTGESEVAVLKQTETKPVGEKQVVTLGTIKLSNGLRGCVTNFNKKSEKYRIEIIEYAEGTSYEAGVMRLNNEIIAGNIPDIINITDGTEEFYAAKGIFEDLKPYLDGEEGIQRADYFDNILSAMETNGKLYFLSPDFYIDTIAGKTEVVGEGYNWTMEDMKNLVEAREEGVRLFSDETKSGVLNIYLRYNIAQFFDLNSGFCEFDNEAFREILEFANRFPSVASVENASLDWERARNGELLLMKSKIMGISDYQLYHNIFDADISFVGYPSRFESGSVAKGGMVTVAMNAESENKEGAWVFIRSFLEEDYQNKYTDFFPLLVSAFDHLADAAMLSTIRTNENGERVNGGESIIVSMSTSTPLGEVKVFGVDLYPAKEEEVIAIRGLIESIDRMERFDETVLSIISEEAGAYFNGQKSVDEVVAVIQSRANIYMNENR